LKRYVISIMCYINYVLIKLLIYIVTLHCSFFWPISSIFFA